MINARINALASHVLAIFFERGEKVELTRSGIMEGLEKRANNVTDGELAEILNRLVEGGNLVKSEAKFAEAWCITEKGYELVSRSLSLKKMTNSIYVQPTPMDILMETLVKIQSKYGEEFPNIGTAFAAGTVMADYIVVTNIAFDELENNNVEEVYGDLKNKMFATDDGTALEPMSTIGILDVKNKRFLYAVVERPGVNTVYYQNTPDDATVTEIACFGTDNVKRSMRFDPVWKDGNNFDKVMMASMFGFEYDRKDDRILIPPGRCMSATAQAKCIVMDAIRSLQESGDV